MKGHSDQLINGTDSLPSSAGFLAKNIKYESMEANYPCQFFCNWVWSANNSKFLNRREAKQKAQNNGIRRCMGKRFTELLTGIYYFFNLSQNVEK